jgi:hypothetical protein
MSCLLGSRWACITLFVFSSQPRASPSQEAKGRGPRRRQLKAALVGMRDEKTQVSEPYYGVEFRIDGLHVVSYMIGSHRYYG